MFGRPVPTRKPKPPEFAVLVVTAMMILIAVGIVAVGLAYHAPEARRELAEAMKQMGFWSLGTGIAVVVSYGWDCRLTG